ncbi:MAG: hypothetical protein CVV64_06025 [Candidatus Wallbacteria bacterium HGW-Wallbacteria-1]|jgi:TolA-binding protein|uniref:Outer membrane lipoprotein BamD-like domain-containing protein n=1 Tax=Candidatus Wallbacteria bacterium HGW-Wallbacteria-1 TaxID=2013854 RepID=A0A2N1PSK7_9BACT|nr:MAG: hypothetical protein CVV64_06025 [Candidatus Wallbacteria bacterium HGW-Wallbacteria-1]
MPSSRFTGLYASRFSLAAAILVITFSFCQPSSVLALSWKAPEDAVLYEKGMDCEDRGDYSRSIAAFSELVRKYPDSKWADDALFFIGECLAKQKKYADAIESYKRVVIRSVSPELSADALYMIGDCYVKLDDNANAVMVFETLKKNYSDSIWAADMDKLIARYSPVPRKGINTFSSADTLQLNANSQFSGQDGGSSGSANLGVSGDTGSSSSSTSNGANATMAEASDPNMDSVLYEVGLNFHEKGSYDKAIEIYERINRNFPQSRWIDDVRYMLGEARVARGEYNEALKMYRMVLTGKKAVFHPDAQFMIAECLLTMGQHQEAMDNYRLLITHFPKSDWKIDAMYMIGECCIAMGDFKGAADQFRGLIREFPDSDWVVDVKKALRELGEDIEDKAPLTQKDVEKISASPSWKAHFDLGVKLKNEKRFEEAVVAFQEAGRLNPRTHEPLWGMGLIYTQQEDYTRAVRVLEKAAELDERNPDVLSLLGYVYYLKGDFQKSIEAYKRVIACDPNSKFIRDVNYAIAKVRRKMGR